MDKTKQQQQRPSNSATQKTHNKPQQKQNLQTPKQNPTNKKPGSNW